MEGGYFDFCCNDILPMPEKTPVIKKIFLHYIEKNLERCETQEDLENMCHYAANQFYESLKETYAQDPNKSYALMVQEMKNMGSFEEQKGHIKAKFIDYFYSIESTDECQRRLEKMLNVLN